MFEGELFWISSSVNTVSGVGDWKPLRTMRVPVTTTSLPVAPLSVSPDRPISAATFAEATGSPIDTGASCATSPGAGVPAPACPAAIPGIATSAATQQLAASHFFDTIIISPVRSLKRSGEIRAGLCAGPHARVACPAGPIPWTIRATMPDLPDFRPGNGVTNQVSKQYQFTGGCDVFW